MIGFRQNPQSAAANYALRFKIVVDRGEKSTPRADSPGISDDLGTVGIVERQDRRLSKRIRRPQAGGMIGVAFDFGRASFVAFDKDSGAHSAHRKSGGKKQRPAGDDFLRLVHVRHDLLVQRSRSDSR